MDSKKYNRIKLSVNISEGITSFILIFLFVALGFSERLVYFLSSFSNNNYSIFLLFTAVTGIGMGILFFPVDYYLNFYLEHKYDLSNQTFFKWIWEKAKGLLLSLIIGVPLLLFFFYVLNTFGNLWWLPFAVVLFLLSVVLARIVPVLILPLFYKVTPVDNEELKKRIKILAEEAGIKVENVYKFDMSKNTKKANAAFTGIGKSKRILLGDTLLNSYTNDEIETVIAHELGHYKRKHIIKNIIIGTASSFLVLFILSILYKISLGWFGFNKLTAVGALPLIPLWGMLIGIIQTPLTNILSRKYEYEADEYAISSTHKTEAFISTLEKLTEQNLGDKDPHPLVEWFFYSHPSIKNRIAAIKNFVSSQENIGDNVSLKFEGNKS